MEDRPHRGLCATAVSAVRFSREYCHRARLKEPWHTINHELLQLRHSVAFGVCLSTISR